METVSLPKTTYKKLVEKAQMMERFLTYLQEKFPSEVYSEKRLREFTQNDRISPKLKKDILTLLNQVKRSA